MKIKGHKGGMVWQEVHMLIANILYDNVINRKSKTRYT